MFAFTRKDVDAKVVGNALVVSFQSVDVQKTWRADMAGLASASLELQGEGTKHSVVLKKADAQENIATFSDRESAVYALNVITSAMLKGDTQQVAAQGGRAMIIVTKLFKLAVALVLLMTLYAFLAPALLGPSVITKNTPRGTERVGQLKPGEAVPADQLFGKPKGK